MFTLNQVTLYGRLAKDPQVNLGKTGNRWSKFTIVTVSGRKEGSEWIEEPQFHDVVVTADGIAKHTAEQCYKGCPLLVKGKIKYRRYTTKDGVEKHVAEVIADEVVFTHWGTKDGQIDVDGKAEAAGGKTKDDGVADVVAAGAPATSGAKKEVADNVAV